jgi:hypothetical protein
LTSHCLSDPKAPYVDSQGQVKPGGPRTAPASKGKAAVETTLFDVIVAASVCDEAGMLPALVSTSPRLKQTQHARIYALTYAWGFVADSVKSYLDMR